MKLRVFMYITLHLSGIKLCDRYSIQDVTSVTLFEVIFFKIICLFGNPKKLIFDEAKGQTSKVIMSLYESLGIEPFTISQNHGSNRTERYIRTKNDMICKYLTNTGDK